MAGGNPFYIEPLGGYGQQIAEGLGGLGSVLKEQQKLKEQKQKQEELANLYQTGTPDDLARFSIKNPEFSKKIDDLLKFKNDNTKENFKESMQRIIAGEDPQKVILERAQFVQSQGGDPIDTMNELAEYDTDPKNYLSKIQKLYSTKYPNEWLAYRTASAPVKGEALTGNMANLSLAMFGTADPAQLSSEQRKYLLSASQEGSTTTQKEYQQAVKEGFNGSFIDYQKSLKGGPDADLKSMMLQTQIMDLQDRIGTREEKQKSAEEAKIKSAYSSIRKIDSTLEEVKKAKDLAENSFTATGITGAVSSKVPTTPAYNLRKTIDTVKANLGFDRLQEMRDASPTGGALGSITEKELDRLEATLANLDPNMGEKELLQNLSKVQEHYNNWKAAIEQSMPSRKAQTGQTSTNEAGKSKGDMRPPINFTETEFEKAAKKFNAKTGRNVTPEQMKKMLGM